MRFIKCISCVVLVVFVAMAFGAPTGSDIPDPKPHYNLDDAPALFEKYIKDFDKKYADEADKQVHYGEFVKTLQSINRLNSDPEEDDSFDINLYADYTAEQRKQLFGLGKIES